MKKILAATCCCATLATAALGEDLPSVQPYLGLGTTGGVLGARYNINELFAISGDIQGFSYKKNVTANSADFDAKLKMFDVGIYGDYFPFANNFHISIGALFGNDKVTADAKLSKLGTIKLNGTTYHLNPGESVNAEVKFQKVRPYIGFGYASRSQKGFGFFANLGVAYGKMDTTADASATLRAIPGFNYNLDKERQKIEDKANKYLKFYPVFKLGVSYAF